MIHLRSVTAACLVGILAVASAAWAADGPEDAAQPAAESWLRLVDGADYGAAWTQAARALKGAVEAGGMGRDGREGTGPARRPGVSQAQVA